jgi:hypothetical protein
MRCKPEALSPDRSWVNFLAVFFSPSLLARFPAKFESALSVDDLCRQRNLANAASTHSSVATRVGQRSVPFMVAGCVALHLQLQPSMLHRTSI